MIYKSIEELIGNTPMLELERLEGELGLKSRVIAKLESFNPAGSSKDRAAKNMLDEAEKSGQLKPGGTVIEATSGNTGIGLSMLGVLRGYKVIIVMPDTASKERILSMEAYGAKVVLTDGKEGMIGATKRAEEIAKVTENSFIVSQFENLANSDAHYKTTGPEILKNTEGCVDIFVSAIGTGGTITGTAKYLKEHKPSTLVYGVEPSASPLLTKGVAGPHKIQGIGANFIPKNLNKDIIDEVVTVTDEEAYEYAKELSATEGLFVGISAGATLCAMTKIAMREENKGKTIVAILTDGGERYLSTPNFI
jgi:cysteine synthase A